jgi:LEA14-like dessication related protein
VNILFVDYVGYYDISVAGIQAAVYDGDITLKDAGITHGVTVNAGVEGGLTVVDHVLVEVKRIMQVVLRGTWETGTDSRGQGQREVGFKTGVQYGDIA